MHLDPDLYLEMLYFTSANFDVLHRVFTNTHQTEIRETCLNEILLIHRLSSCRCTEMFHIGRGMKSWAALDLCNPFIHPSISHPGYFQPGLADGE